MVTLTWAEMQLAYMVAGQRRLMNMKSRKPARYGAPEGDDGEAIDIVACRGEMAVAKALNLFWSGSVGNYDAHDVGDLVEVRTITSRWHKLIVHPTDKDNAPYVLVFAGTPPEMLVVGWIYARDAKRDEWWSDPSGNRRPAYFVPQEALRPMDELITILQREEVA